MPGPSAYACCWSGDRHKLDAAGFGKPKGVMGACVPSRAVLLEDRITQAEGYGAFTGLENCILV